MTTDVLGGGLALALAAALWLFYLMPAWFRRKEYLATERNAVRLQQTLRIMAETAEMPEEVRAEVSRRGVVEQRRAERRRRRAAINAAKVARSDVTGVLMGGIDVGGRGFDGRAHSNSGRTGQARLGQSRVGSMRLGRLDSEQTGVGAGVDMTSMQPAKARAAAARATAQRRLRRARLVTTLVTMLALAAGIASLIQFSGGAAGAGVFALVSLGVVLAGGALLGAMASVSRRRAGAQPTLARSAAPLYDHGSHQQPVAERRDWTPTQLPKPLYLSASSTGMRSAASSAAVSSERGAVGAGSVGADAAGGPATDPARVAAQERRVAAVRLQQESRDSEEALRQAQRAVPAIGIDVDLSDDNARSAEGSGVFRAAAPPPSGVQAAVSRAASAGQQTAPASGALGDLDAVMRRRRRAG